MPVLETGAYELVYSAYRIYLPHKPSLIVPDYSTNLNLQGNIYRDLLVRNTIGAPTAIMTKRIFEEVGGFDETMRSLEDWDFALRVARNYPIGFVPEVLLEVKSSAGGVSSNQAEYYKNRCYMLKKYRSDYLKLGVFDTAVQDILNMAKRDGIEEQVSKMILLYMT